METTKKPVKPSPTEYAGDRASEWATIRSIAEKVGCSPETLRLWVRQAERDRGERADLSTDKRARLKALEREFRELRQANEILRKPPGDSSSARP